MEKCTKIVKLERGKRFPRVRVDEKELRNVELCEDSLKDCTISLSFHLCAFHL